MTTNHNLEEVATDSESLEQQLATQQAIITDLQNQLAQHRRTEAHLGECLRFLQRILDVVPDLVIVFDLGEQRIVYLNGEAQEMIGYSGNELKELGNRVLTTLVHPDDMPVMERWQTQIASAQDGQIIEYENRMRHADGTWRWHYSRARVFTRNEAGIPQQAIITIRDITTLKEAEAAIHELNETLEQRVAERTAEVRESQALLKGVVDNSPAAIFVKDIHGRFVLFNHHVASMIHHNPKEAIGKTDEDIYPPELASMFRADDQHVLETGQPIEVEEVAMLDDGEHTFLTIKFPVYNPEGTVYAIGGICTDITQRKRQEEEKKQLEAMRTSMQEQVIEAQQRAIRELSSPLLPMSEGVLALPLIGDIDEERAQQIMETLLEGISRHRADIALVDITGVRNVDMHVAQALAAMARAVQLLGARVVLTGIQPQIAQNFVQLGADLAGVVTRSTFQEGITYALRMASSRRTAK